MAEYRPPISSATQAAITAEATTRASADTALSAADVAEATARANADSAEVTARTNAINTAIAGEAAARTTGDATNATAISTEATTRAAADTANADAISVEATSRIAADTTLTTAVGSKASTAALTAETDARVAADTALDGRLDAAESGSRVIAGGALGATPTIALLPTDRTVVVTGTLTADAAVAITGIHALVQLVLRFTQDGTGGRLVTWPSGTKFPGGAIALSTAPGAVDVLSAYSPDGSNLDVFLAGQAMA